MSDVGHKLEKVLSSKFSQWFMKQMAKKGDESGECYLDGLFEWYGGYCKGIPPLKYIIPYTAIEMIRKKAGFARDTIQREVFNFKPAQKGLVNTVRSLGDKGLIKPQVFQAPLMVVWNFTQACNFQCKHCYQDAHKKLSDELTLEEQFKIVDELDELDVPLLAFAGGEPLMSKNFWAVAERAASYGIYVTVATNGSLVTKDVAKRMVDIGVDYVEISVDSSSSDYHDNLRGHEGYWDQAVQGLKNAVEVGGLKVGFAPTITRNNYDQFDDMVKLARDIGVDVFYVFNFIPAGRAKDILDSDITPEMRESLLQKVYKYMCEDEIEMVSTSPQLGRVCIQNFNNGDKEFINTGHYGKGLGTQAKVLAKYIGGCGAGRCYCAVQPNGIVTPCVFLPITVGNLKNQTLKEIWDNTQVFDVLRDRSEDNREGHCAVCDYKFYCGGCRARAYGYYGDVKAPDPGCIFNKSDWDKLNNK